MVAFNRNRDKLTSGQIVRAQKSGLDQIDLNDDGSKQTKIGLDSNEIEHFIRQHLNEQMKSKGSENCLDLFTTNELIDGLKRFVDSNLIDSIQNMSKLILDKVLRYLRIRKVPEERIIADILAFSLSRYSASEKDKLSIEEEIDRFNCNFEITYLFFLIFKIKYEIFWVILV